VADFFLSKNCKIFYLGIRIAKGTSRNHILKRKIYFILTKNFTNQLSTKKKHFLKEKAYENGAK